MDRNYAAPCYSYFGGVALRKESVDRNNFLRPTWAATVKSLSARRAWIEIEVPHNKDGSNNVALRKESVDRNFSSSVSFPSNTVALRKESVDRNLDYCDDEHTEWSSLSARRAWIEISVLPD